MALHDYSEIDEADFYGQGFERSGVLSIWAGQSDSSIDTENLDVLQDLCGVGYYDLDNQEGNCHGNKLVSLADLLRDLSYSESFMTSALQAAAALGISNARWVVVQYDFAYAPNRVKRAIHADPKFIGVFPYEVSDLKLIQ
ncbi:MAG: immunity 22 family protein [Planctomycetaceae bacterium]